MWPRAAHNNLVGRVFDTPVIQEIIVFSFPPEKQESILWVKKVKQSQYRPGQDLRVPVG
jgi:hypothetical protein